MSADNWAACPGCKVIRALKLEDLDAAIAEAYGSATRQEYDALRAQRAQLESEPSDQTFREDYEIYGAESGTVRVSYGGSCSRCGTSLSFEVERPIDLSGVAR